MLMEVQRHVNVLKRDELSQAAIFTEASSQRLKSKLAFTGHIVCTDSTSRGTKDRIMIHYTKMTLDIVHQEG
jgi:hypothetical protein